jgi:Flp pilus assembly protein protease CpaA
MAGVWLWPAVPVLVCTALNDLLYGRIEHRWPGMLLGIFLASLLAKDTGFPLGILFWVAGWSIAGIVFFAAGLWGGGDAKLAPVLALGIAPEGQIHFLWTVAWTGGVLALLWTALFPWIRQWRPGAALVWRIRASENLLVSILLPSALKQRHTLPLGHDFPYGVPLVVAFALCAGHPA